MKKRKAFISYHHKDVAFYHKFISLTQHTIVNKSVIEGAIGSNIHDQNIKEFIQQNNLKDATVLVVLVGAKTYSRKHVDWEISGALNRGVGDIYAGLLGIRLPSHSDHGIGDHKYNANNIPARLVDNLDSGYAKIYDWSGDRNALENWIHEAFYRRNSHGNKRINSRAQMIENK
ncbi:TIR domain-containing protein [Dokdonia sp.]|uniref:TIR domain-containing protein n=1 Tax=Dokdonia sp. TaxID=2024995 RepID=UPI003263DE99